MHLAPLDRVRLGPSSRYRYRYWLMVGTEAQLAQRLDTLWERHSAESSELADTTAPLAAAAPPSVKDSSGMESPSASRPNILVILTDDQGYADLGVQDQVKDIRTPNIDALAGSGVRCSAAYITAPQCTPSRAGLLTGRYQQRFGLDTIPDCPLPLEEVTIAERLSEAGYICGMVGKWHLEPNVLSTRWMRKNLPDQADKPRHQVRLPHEQVRRFYPDAQGFQEYFKGELHRYWANFDLDGNSLNPAGEWVQTEGRYRIEVKTGAALAFLHRNQSRPFFLYLAYMAPHTPLDAPRRYLDRFPGDMPKRRRYALAMQAAIDEGVGRIIAFLHESGLETNTLVFYTSDNGAPIHHKRDTPIHTDMGGWDGSLNDPWIGEKGMLTEGGIRVPFVVRWPGVLPAGAVHDPPVSSLDIAATAAAVAGQPHDPRLDGVNLIPLLTGEQSGAPHDALFWRFWNQAAVRSGFWKYLQAGNAGEYLFDLSTDAHEERNLIETHPDVAARLKARLQEWTRELQPPGMPDRPLNNQEGPWYQEYLGLETPPPRSEGSRRGS
jgi:arylsulfatase A-like enzyme